MKKLLITFVLVLSFSTCGFASAAEGTDQDPVDPDITSGKALQDFKQAREKWLAQGVSSYKVKVRRSCFCASPFAATMTVRDGKVKNVSAKPWYGPRTIPGMFRIVGQAIKNKVAVLDVTYHPTLGFPRTTWIDYIAMAADDEIGYGLSGFRALKP